MGRDAVVLFDVFRTLLAFDGDHVDETTFPFLADWLGYRGWDVAGEQLRTTYDRVTQEQLAAAPGDPPDVEVTRVWAATLQELGGPSPSADVLRELALTYRQITTRSLAVWPGTFEMLEACTGVRIAIASNTQRAFTEAELRRLDLYDRFEVVVFSSDVGACKPDPAPLVRAMEQLGVAPDRTVYVGDNAYEDAVAATRAGVPAVILDRGTPVPDGVTLPTPLAMVPGDKPVDGIEIARNHLDVD